MIIDWVEITRLVLVDLWEGFLNFIPSLIGALVVFAFGWLIATWVGGIVTGILRRLKFDKIFEKGGWKEALTKAELKVDVAGFIGVIAKWVLVIVFLQIAVRILGLYAFVNFLEDVLAYLPNVIIASLIFIVTVIIVDIVEKVVRTGVERIKVGYGQIASAIVKWSIWIFAILAILHQLRIAPMFMETLFVGIVAMLVISFGLAFGLGGREVAAEILQALRRKLKG